jgi:hypothetical protein
MAGTSLDKSIKVKSTSKSRNEKVKFIPKLPAVKDGLNKAVQGLKKPGPVFFSESGWAAGF